MTAPIPLKRNQYARERWAYGWRAVYFGKIRDKPYIGDDARPVPVRAEDIPGANRLMYMSSLLMLILALRFRTMRIGVV